jgi:hypothetical protein
MDIQAARMRIFISDLKELVGGGNISRETKKRKETDTVAKYGNPTDISFLTIRAGYSKRE